MSDTLERRKFQTHREFRRTLRAAKETGGRPAWVLLYTVGTLCLRICEAHKIHHGDLDLDEGSIAIRTAKQKKETVDTRSLSPRLLKVLRGWVRLHGEGPLFPWTKRTSQRMFERACMRAGVRRGGVGVHSLRHMRCVKAAQEGWPLPDIMALGRWRSLHAAQTYINTANINRRMAGESL